MDAGRYNRKERARLYEEADDRAQPSPLWRLDAARTLFVGSLDYNAAHQHGAPVFLSSLGGPFGLKLGSERWQACEAAMIPAGCEHELRLDGEPVAALYLEPGAAGPEALAALVAEADESGGAIVGRSPAVSLVRQLYEDRESLGWAGEALDDLLRFAAPAARRALDHRAARAAAMLRAAGDESPTLADCAASVGLSPSRLRHIFAQDVGVPLKRYRAWVRMRRAIGVIVDGQSFTAAAHEAGFADQAHFGHDFRRTFGAAPSRSLRNVRRAPPNRAASAPSHG